MYCRYCGNKLGDSHHFCAKCGNRVRLDGPDTFSVRTEQSEPLQPVEHPAPKPEGQPIEVPVQNPETTTSAGEGTTTDPAYGGHGEYSKALLVLATSRKLSVFKVISCYVVFFPDRIVMAHLSTERQKAESARVAQEAKANGLGFFKGSAAMMRYWAAYADKYYTMDEHAILAEDPTNYTIHNSTVSGVLFKCYSTTTDYSNDTTQSSDGTLNFSLTGGQKIKLNHKLHHDKMVRETLTRLFGGRLKYKK